MVFAAANDPWEYLKPWNAIANTPETRPLNSVGEFLGLGLNILLGTALAISMISLIMSGIKIIMSKGDPKAKSAAHQALTWAVVAFVLTVGAFTVKQIIFNVVGGDFGELTNATPNI